MRRKYEWEKLKPSEVPRWVLYSGVYPDYFECVELKGKHYRYLICSEPRYQGDKSFTYYRKLRRRWWKKEQRDKQKENKKKNKSEYKKIAFILVFLALSGYFLYSALHFGDVQLSFQNMDENIDRWRSKLSESIGLNSNISKEYIPYSKASGSEVCLINYKNATDPTWNELISFLQIDDTDKQPYNFSSFVCADFAERLHNNAESSGIRAAWVSVDFESGEGHALNAFNTTDKGLVYVDCTQSLIITGFTDNVKRKEYEHDDKIAYIAEGKEYGLISIDKAISPEYWFYEEYIKKWEKLEEDIDVYNNDVEAYEKERTWYEKILGGRIYIDNYEEYKQLERIYNKLKKKERELNNRGEELDKRREELGYYYYESLGIVATVEIYW